MLKEIIGIFLVLSIFISCDNRVIADFEIVNNTGIKIDSLVIEPNTNEKEKYISLNPSEEVEYKANMTGIAKIDGSYRLAYKQNGKLFVKGFGYYTNGYPTEKLRRIFIEKDTIKFDVEFGNY